MFIRIKYHVKLIQMNAHTEKQMRKDLKKISSVLLNDYAVLVGIPTEYKEDKENYISLIAFALRDKQLNTFFTLKNLR